MVSAVCMAMMLTGVVSFNFNRSPTPQTPPFLSSSVSFARSSSSSSFARSSSSSVSPSLLFATVEKEAPVRSAPASASAPPFRNSDSGLPKEIFLKSDESKPDLGEELIECPLTIWDFEGIDTDAIDRNIPTTQCPFEVSPPSAGMTIDEERVYFSENKDSIRQLLLEHGSLWVRGFALPRTVAGHREMYEALDMTPCLDPLHSSGLRKFASERDCIYEEVNKEVSKD